MEKLDSMIVHGAMLSDPNLASPSLATLMICGILLRLVTSRFFKTEMYYLQTSNIEMQHKHRASHTVVTFMPNLISSDPIWRRMKKKYGGQFLTVSKPHRLHRICLTCISTMQQDSSFLYSAIFPFVMSLTEAVDCSLHGNVSGCYSRYEYMYVCTCVL